MEEDVGERVPPATQDLGNPRRTEAVGDRPIPHGLRFGSRRSRDPVACLDRLQPAFIRGTAVAWKALWSLVRRLVCPQNGAIGGESRQRNCPMNGYGLPTGAQGLIAALALGLVIGP